ncbi:MAG: hypothetical protein ACJ72V_13480, partial [Nitrososphaeraceae archaeon]
VMTPGTQPSLEHCYDCIEDRFLETFISCTNDILSRNEILGVSMLLSRQYKLVYSISLFHSN